MRTAGPSLTVVKTTTGTAQSVAVAIDESGWPEVVGTISGDDTIFIATEDGREQRKLRERLRDIFGIVTSGVTAAPATIQLRLETDSLT